MSITFEKDLPVNVTQFELRLVESLPVFHINPLLIYYDIITGAEILELIMSLCYINLLKTLSV